MRRVVNLFVTGATGFIGGHMVQQALAAGHEVFAHRRPHSLPRMALAKQPQWVDAALDEPGLKECLSTCQVLIHLAAVWVNGRGDWQECFDVNVRQSLGCWRNALRAGVPRILVCGSCFEYGSSAERYDFIPTDAPLEPTSAYAASKAAASLAAWGLGVDSEVELAILRPFHVFGEGEPPERFWPSLRRAALDGKDFPMTLGEQVRDFVPVETVAKAFLDFAIRGSLGRGKPEIHHLGTGRPLTLRDFAQQWWRHWNAAGQLLPGALPYRPREVMRYVPLVD